MIQGLMLVAIIIIFTLMCTIFYSIKSSKTLSEIKKERIKNQYISSMCLFLALLAGLRNIAVGPDTYMYYERFEDIAGKSFSTLWYNFVDYYFFGQGKDEGYPILMKLFQYVFPSFRLFLIATSLFFYSGVAYIIKENTFNLKQAFLSIILFVTLFQIYAFSAIRQDIALAGVMWSYKFIKDRRLIPFLIIILLVSTIHKSVLIFIPYYWIATFKKVKLLATLSIVLIPLSFFMATELTFMLVDGSGSDQYAYYLTQDADAGTPTFTVLLIFSFLFYLVMLNRLNKTIPQHYYFTNTIYFTLGLAPITWVVPDFMRVLLYFSIFLPIILADSFTSIPNKTIKKIAIVGYSMVVLFLFIKTIPPYEFFWSEMMLGDNYSINVSTAGI